MSEVFVVTMHRNGDAEAHSYVLGVFSTGKKALDAADREVCNRVGQYAPRILAMPPDDPLGRDCSHRTVLRLPDQKPHLLRYLADKALRRRLRENRYAR